MDAKSNSLSELLESSQWPVGIIAITPSFQMGNRDSRMLIKCQDTIAKTQGKARI